MSYMNKTSMLDEMLDGMAHHEPTPALDLPKNEHGEKVQPQYGHSALIGFNIDPHQQPSHGCAYAYSLA